MISRRHLLSSGAVAVWGLPLGYVRAQPTWPDKPVLFVNGFGAGGASDVFTRLLAERLQARFGQNFLVEDRSGAGGNIAMESAMKAPADGYTVCSATIGMLVINQYLFSNMSLDPAKACACVSTFWESANVFVVPAESPARSVKEFLAWAKQKSDGVTYSSSGIGTTPHLAGELFRKQTGISATHIPFRSGTQATAELVSGRIDFSIGNIADLSAMIQSGKLRALAVTSAQRWDGLPDLPTMAEAGIADFVLTSWGALVMPAAAPPAIIDRLAAAVRDIAAEPATKDRFIQAGARLTSATPQETTAFAARERIKWKEAVRLSGAKLG